MQPFGGEDMRLDLALTAFANTARASLRGSDVFARLGGEEFAAILPNTGIAAAVATAERLRIAIQKLDVATPVGPLRFTVSLGVAALDPSREPGTALVDADRCLYDAKRGGRNQVRVQGPATAARTR